MAVTSNEKANKSKYIIIISVILAVIAIIILIVFLTSNSDGKEEKDKLILYRYNIQDFDYNLETNLMYEIEYTGKTNDGEYDNKVILHLYRDDNSCYYNGSAKNAYSGNYISSKSCTFNIEGNKVSIKAKVQNLYVPFEELEKLGYKSKTTEEDLEVSGVFSERHKYLTIGNLKYVNSSYEYLLSNNIMTILFDPKTKNAYTTDGLPAYNTEEEYVETHKIDLSKYKIIEGPLSEENDNSDMETDSNITPPSNNSKEEDNKTDNNVNSSSYNNSQNDVSNNSNNNDFENNTADNNTSNNLNTDTNNKDLINQVYAQVSKKGHDKDVNISLQSDYEEIDTFIKTFKINNKSYSPSEVVNLNLDKRGKNCYNIEIEDIYGNKRKMETCYNFEPEAPKFNVVIRSCEIRIWKDGFYEQGNYNEMKALTWYLDDKILSSDMYIYEDDNIIKLKDNLKPGKHTIMGKNEFGVSTVKDFTYEEKCVVS